jgi:hypothetical protein
VFIVLFSSFSYILNYIFPKWVKRGIVHMLRK